MVTVSMMGDVNIVYINIDFLNETFYEVLLSRILSGLANFSTERSETFRITMAIVYNRCIKT